MVEQARGDRPRPRRSKLLLFPLVAASLFAIGFGTWNAIDNAESLAKVGREASKAERAKGVVRGLASFRAEGKDPVPPCLASYRSGKSTNHTHFSGDNRVTLADGSEYTLPESQKIEFFLNDAPAVSSVSSTTRAYLTRIKPSVKSFSWIACLAPNDRVWIEACVKDDALVGCRNHDDPVLIAIRGPAARASYVQSHAHGSVALALLGVLMLLLIVTAGFRHNRTALESLARSRGVSSGAAGVVFTVIAAFGSFVSICMWATTYGPWFLSAFVALFALGLLLSTVGRMRVVGAARHVVSDTGTTHLNSDEGLERELAVRVAGDAPPIESFRGGDRHAIVRFEIKESYAEKRGSKTVIATRSVAKGVYPKLVPIVDASGRGMLALDHCTIDVPDEREVQFVANLPDQPSWLGAAIGTLERSQTHRHYTVAWGAVQAGEPLLIYGGMERVRPSAVGVPDNSGYREAFDVPLVRGQADAPAIAYVGTEAALTSGIRAERVSLAIAFVFGIGATAAATIAVAWLL